MVIIFCLNASSVNAGVTGSLDGVSFTPAEIKIRKYMEIKEETGTFLTYKLEFFSKDRQQVVDILLLFPSTKTLDGRFFFKVPDPRPENFFDDQYDYDTSDTPYGLPPVQSWGMEDKDTGLLISHVREKQGWLKLKFGKKNSNSISGTIDMNVPASEEEYGQPKKLSFLRGDFVAKFE
jgi:hypothetical protein